MKFKKDHMTKQYLLPKLEWPKELQHKAVRAISVNGCVDGKDLGTALAHAHCSDNDLHQGYICFRAPKMITRTTCLHELAHLIAPRESNHHGPKWIQTLWRLSENSILDRERVIAHIFFGYMSISMSALIAYSMPFIIAVAGGIASRHLLPPASQSTLEYDVVSVIVSMLVGAALYYMSVRGYVLAHMRKINGH